MANVKFNEFKGCFENPAVQLVTSVSQIMTESIDLPSNDEMYFTDTEVENYNPLSDDVEPFQIFKSEDPLTYRKFDPKQFKLAKEINDENSQSSKTAANINPVISQ